MLAWLVPHETAAVSAQVLCTPYNHAPCHFMQSHIRKVYVCLAVTCHLHFWQNDRDLLRATTVVVTRLVPRETATISASSVYTIQPCTVLRHFMQSHIRRVCACLADVTEKFLSSPCSMLCKFLLEFQLFRNSSLQHRC